MADSILLTGRGHKPELLEWEVVEWADSVLALSRAACLPKVA
jgi:hypothetical protein